VSASQAASDVGKAICARYEACAPFLLQFAWGDTTSCASRLSGQFTSTLGAPGTGWTPSAVEACVQALPNASCDELLDHNLPAVCRPPAGQVAEGGACGDNSQCASGYCNLGPGGKCGTCASALGAAGAACYRDEDCAFGTKCTGADVTKSPATAGTCTQPGQSGATCDGTHPCSLTLVCNPAGGGTGGVCGAAAAAGATCSQLDRAPFGNCDELHGLYCNRVSNGTCTMVATAGSMQPCGAVGGVLTACSGGGTCMSMMCLAPAADFGNCSKANGPDCLSPAQCINGVCTLPTPETCR
jgi:hypothetical protein